MKYLIAFLIASSVISLICAQIYNDDKRDPWKVKWPYYYGVCAGIIGIALGLLSI